MWRLVSFARQDQSAPQRVNLNGLVAGLTKFREPEWQVLGLRHQSQLSPEPAEVAGVESQIEQVCLNVLVYAEQRAAASPVKTIAVKTSVLAGRVLLEIDYSPPQGSDTEPDPFADTASAATQGHRRSRFAWGSSEITEAMRVCGAGRDYPGLKSNCRWRRSPTRPPSVRLAQPASSPSGR